MMCAWNNLLTIFMERNNSPRYSIVYLCYDPENKKDFKYKSLWSVIENSVGYDYELVFVKDVKGYPVALNTGLEQSRGDYIVIVSDDVVIHDPRWLTKLTRENAIVSYAPQTFHITGEVLPSGALYGFSREVFNTLGLMDTQYQNGYGYDDIDYFLTAKKHGVELHIEPFAVDHLGSKTYQEYWNQEKEGMTNHNHLLFQTKWNL